MHTSTAKLLLLVLCSHFGLVMGENSLGTRTVSLTGSSFEPGRTNVIRIRIRAQGNETALGCSLHFDSGLLTFIKAETAPEITNATLLVNTNKVRTGVISLAIALKAGQALSKGDRDFIHLHFLKNNSHASSTPSIRFTDSPTPRELVSVKAENLQATFVDFPNAPTSIQKP